jgi:carbamoyl-phosphate synthase large subunit
MKSTGEVMGTATNIAKAYDKAQDATGKPIPEGGTAVIDLSADEFPPAHSEAGRLLIDGYEEFFDIVDFDSEETFVDAIRAGEIDLIVSRQRRPLTVAVEEDITYFSTYPSATDTLEALRANNEPLDVMAVGDRPKRDEYWGQPKRK